MNKKSVRHSSLFLLELVAAIFFFCLAATVCVRFFVKSHSLSQDIRNLDMAVNQSRTFAEVYDYSNDFFSLLSNQCPDGELSEDGMQYTLFYTKDWTSCKQDEGSFSLTIKLTEKTDNFSTAIFTVENITSGEELYSLESGKYTGKEAR